MLRISTVLLQQRSEIEQNGALLFDGKLHLLCGSLHLLTKAGHRNEAYYTFKAMFCALQAVTVDTASRIAVQRMLTTMGLLADSG